MPFYTEVAARLRARLAELSVDLERLESETTQPLDRDWEEQANELEDLATNEALETAHIAEANQIRAALRRIDDGSYGNCEKCGGRIAEARLKAQPTATTCIHCAA